MEAAQCRNCAAPLTGKDCGGCGQAADVHVPITHEVIHEVASGVTVGAIFAYAFLQLE